MESQLHKLGLNYEIISAVDGMKLSAEDLAKYSESAAIQAIGKPLVKTQIGCSLSHLKLYERMVEQGIFECLILEDDIYLGDMFRQILENRNRLPEDWDLVNLCTNAKQEPFGHFIADIYRCSNHLELANRTSAYLITLNGARKLLNKAYPIRYEADGLTGRAHLTGIRSYSVWPPVVALQDVESDIWNVAMVQEVKLKGVKRYLQKISRSIQKRLEPLANPKR
jgi:glycosyl transferase family 25